MAKPTIEHKRFNMNIPNKMYARLKQQAKDEEMTITGLIRQLLRDGLRTMEQEERTRNPASLVKPQEEETELV